MNFSPYDYICGFPLTIPNAVWTTLIALLFVSFVSTYLVKSENVIGRFLKALLAYGKYSTSNRSTDVPKSFFTHYYVVASLWNGYCFYTIIGLCFGFIESNWICNLLSLRGSDKPKGDQLTVLITMAMLTVHSFKRLYECLCVSVFSSKGKLNLVQYAWGFIYYLALAPTLISECLPLNRLPLGSFEFRHAVGIIGFMYASFVHHQSHIILANLRKKNGRTVEKERYSIPQGGLFTLVSCPHYFAEVLIYWVTLLMVRSQCHSWWLVVAYNMVAHANMAMGAHVWYKDTFKNYPKSRKAFIPYIF